MLVIECCTYCCASLGAHTVTIEFEIITYAALFGLMHVIYFKCLFSLII